MVLPRLGDGTTGSYYLLGGGTCLSSDGTVRAQYSRLCQVVVPPIIRVLDDGTANTPKTLDEILFGSNFEAIGTYKYPTLFCMKM